MIKIVRATHRGDYQIELEFSNGEVGRVDLSDLVQRPGSMVIPLREPETFRAFFLELGALGWPNGFELSPEALYRKARRPREGVAPPRSDRGRRTGCTG